MRRISFAKWLLPVVVAGLALVATAQRASAQLPTVRLLSVFPAGGKQGTAIEVVLTGSDFEDVNQLYFDHAGLKAEQVTEMKDGKVLPVAGKFKITIDPTTPVGLHDVRAIGRYGISNPRTFVVSDGLEANETEPNNTPAQAQRILSDKVPVITVNGQINGATDIDCFAFSARAGQRVLVDCQAQRIDSRLNGRLTLAGPTGKLIAANDDFHGRDPFLDVTIPADGDYVIGITDQVFDGSPEYFYRLTIGTFPYIDYVLPPVGNPGPAGQFTLYGRNLPGSQPAQGVSVDGRPLEQLAVQIAVPGEPIAQQRLSYTGLVLPHESTTDGFEYRLATPQGSSNGVRLGITTLPLIQGIEPNDAPDKAQPITTPCEIYGQFQAPRDVDWYSFKAKPNEVWVFEVISQRTGFPTDPFLVLRRASDGAQISEVDDDATNPIPLRFDVRSDDPVLQSPPLAEGEYQVAVRDLNGAARGNPRYVYRLRVRPLQPDFRLLVMHNAPVLPNVAQPPDSLLVRQGGNQHLDVVAIRRDGFAGDITIQVQGLPAGVTCPPVTIGPAINPTTPVYVPLVFSAADNAPSAVATVTVTGTATINGQPVTREARPGVITWGFDPNQQIPAQSRLARSLTLAVREGAPYRVVATPEKVTLSRGLPLKLKLQITRRGDFKAQVDNVTAVSLPPNAQNAAVGIPADKNEVELTLNMPPNVPVGNYTVAVRGNAPAVPFTKDPEGKNKQNVQVGDISTPVIVTITDPVGMAVKPSPATVKKGANVEVVVTATRQGGFAGKVQLEVINLPANVTAPKVEIPENANEAKVVINAAANAANGNFGNLQVRATVQVNNQAINIDTPLTLVVE